MRHRGPDAAGVFDVARLSCRLGHARLSIIDVDARSNQPFVSRCGRYILSFNGEIYNYLALRRELECLGRSFRTQSDTEVLLEWLMAHGAEGVSRLEGMFAFAFLDGTSGELLLARDHIGEKPLYYSRSASTSSSTLAFASEIKGLLQLPWVDTSLDQEAMATYLRFLYTAPPNTFYRGIKELPPGHMACIQIRPLQIQVRCFYDCEQHVGQHGDASYDQAVAGFREAFLDSVKLRLRSDVAVGLYLSGGLDSNGILAAAKALNSHERLASFTVRFPDRMSRTGGDESGLAREVAGLQGISNRQVEFDIDDDVLAAVERSLDLFDQPFGNSTTIVADSVAGLAAEECRVCLVGDGGDEILVGYPRYKGLLARASLGPMGRLVGRVGRFVLPFVPESNPWSTSTRRLKQFVAGLDKPVEDCYLSWVTYAQSADVERALGRNIDSPLFHTLADVFRRHASSPLLASAIVDLKSFVPFNLMQCADRVGMAHSLELRCPYLAPPLIHFALGIPDGHKVARDRPKPLLVDALGSDLPRVVRSQPKRPFNPPIQCFLRKKWGEVDHLLTRPQSELRGLIGDEFLQSEVRRFSSGMSDNSTMIWALLVLETWLSRRGAAQGRRRAA